MEINIQRLEDKHNGAIHNVKKIEFPSKTKARKFIRTLILKHEYTSVIDLKNIPLVILIYCKQISYNNFAWGAEIIDYTEYLISHPPKLQPAGQVINGLPYTDYGVHYITKNINNSDLALRYYIDFDSRPDYIGKWFVKCKRTKKYLGVTEAEAKMISEDMCTDGFTRVIGFRERCGFRRLVVNDEGTVRGTLNNNPQQGAVLNISMIKAIKLNIGEQNGN